MAAGLTLQNHETLAGLIVRALLAHYNTATFPFPLPVICDHPGGARSLPCVQPLPTEMWDHACVL